MGAASAAERQKIAPTIIPNFNQPDLSVNNSAYTLKPDELKYDCKKLTGHMQLRIRQYRSTSADKKTSELSRGMQRAATPFVAGTNRGIDPEGDNARDLSMLKAYNKRLAEKNCQPFDLDTDLKPGATHDPRPIAKAKAPRANPFAKAPATANPALASPAVKTP